MSVEKVSVNKNRLLDLSASLCKAEILILGSLALERSLAKNLYQAGAKKIIFLQTEPADQVLKTSSNRTEFGQTIDAEWTLANIEKYVSQANIVIDALSDWQKKLTLSDICMGCEKTLVHSGINGFRFQIYTMKPGKSACLRCALPLAGIDDVPVRPNSEETISPVIELASAWQSLEAIKYLATIGVSQGNELFKFDCLSGEFEVIRGLDARPDCPDCGRKMNQRSR